MPLLLAMLFTSVCFFENSSVAQTIDPYHRMVDPRAIARLDGPDAEPLHQSSGYGYNGIIDSVDHYTVLARDSGAGIITHIWLVSTADDSLTDFRIYIDDTLIVSTHFLEFFGTQSGVLRPPFDTTFPGGNVSDVQMPYRRNFMITMKVRTNNFYYAIAWRPVLDPKLVIPFKVFPHYAEAFQQQMAENRFHDDSSPWSSDSAKQLSLDGGIRGADTVLLASLEGHGMIQTIHLQPSTYDRMVLDSILLEMYWDHSPQPAVRVPVNDFFGSSTGPWKNRSYWIRVDPGLGYTCFFPMPFARGAKIRLINTGSTTVSFQGYLRYDTGVIDPAVYGYFNAQFHESNPTRYGIFHDVLHTNGRGRFIGMNWSIPNSPSPVALEGDPFINVDSVEANLIHYTGSEDYINGGWWFFGAVFSARFSGFTHIFDSFYRFHILDAIDYKYSIDYNLQHGVRNDVSDDYRTVAYFYQHHIPFWTDRDTIRRGEQWVISGNGYAPNEALQIALGVYSLANLHADAKGAFTVNLPVPSTLRAGSYLLWVNNETKPRPVTLLSAPSVRLIADSLPVTVRFGDTLLVTGMGFQPGESVLLYLDSILVSGAQTITVGNDYRFTATMHIPYLPNWDYHVVARGKVSGAATYPQTIHLTRDLNYEFEDLVPTALHSDTNLAAQNISFYWQDRWSHQAFAIYKPTVAHSFVGFKFYVPHADSFDVNLFASVGKAFGNYQISLDGKPLAVLNGYKVNWTDPFRSDTLHGGVWFMTQDTHYIHWSCIGKHDSATGYWLGADNISLRPVTHLPLAPGTYLPQPSVVEPSYSPASDLLFFPNPSSSGSLTVRLLLTQAQDSFASGQASIVMYDMIGRQVLGLSNLLVGSRVPNWTINTASLPPGSYLCRVTLSRGAQKLSREGNFVRVK